MKLLFTASTFSHIAHFHLPYLQWFQARGWTVHVACGGCPADLPGATDAQEFLYSADAAGHHQKGTVRSDYHPYLAGRLFYPPCGEGAEKAAPGD